jgi:hypothetical protein
MAATRSKQPQRAKASAKANDVVVTLYTPKLRLNNKEELHTELKL